MALTRQQRRKRLSELTKRGPALVRSGLPARHGADDIVALGLILRHKLADTRVADRASQVAALAAAVFETSLAAHKPRDAIACRAGCAHCCKNTTVAVTAPEAFLLARHLRWAQANAENADLAGVRAAVTRLAAQPAAISWSTKSDCPMLSEDNCSVYAVRPLACRHLASMSLEACIAIYQNKDVQVPVPRSQALIGQGVKFAYMAAIRAVGLSDAIYEMQGALRRALAAENGEARWLAGADVLAGALADPHRPPEVERVMAGFVADIRELAAG